MRLESDKSLEPNQDATPPAVVDKATLDLWEAEARKRLSVKVAHHQSEIDDDFKPRYDDEIDQIEKGEKVSTYMASDALASIFQQMVREGIATYGNDMGNYDAFMKRFESFKAELSVPISVLSNVAEKFNELKKQAEMCLEKEDANGYRENLSKRTLLIADLPNRMFECLRAVNAKDREELKVRLEELSESAKHALQVGTFAQGVLLTSKGSESGDQNDLELLIDWVKTL